MKAYEYIELVRARARLDRPRRGRPARLRRGAVAHRAHRRPADRPASRRARSSDEEFFRVNALLLRNPSVVNMLDGCAISIPCHAPGELPVGLMIWQSAMRDDTVLNIALQARSRARQNIREFMTAAISTERRR